MKKKLQELKEEVKKVVSKAVGKADEKNIKSNEVTFDPSLPESKQRWLR